MRAKTTKQTTQRISDPLLREAVFQRRKNSLFRRAAELATMCDAQVAVIVFGPNGDLAQFSSSTMESTLREFGKQCTKPHEMQTVISVQKRAAENATRSNKTGAKRSRLAAASGPSSGAAGGEGTTAAADAIDALLNATQSDDEEMPDNDGAFEEIDKEFEKLIQDRAKRAEQQQQQGSAAAPTTATTATCGADATLAAAAAVSEAAEAAAAITTATAVTDTDAQATNAFASLAAALAGAPSPSAPISRPPHATAAAAATGDVCLSPGQPQHTDAIVATPAVANMPPVAASADAVPLIDSANALPTNDKAA